MLKYKEGSFHCPSVKNNKWKDRVIGKCCEMTLATLFKLSPFLALTSPTKQRRAKLRLHSRCHQRIIENISAEHLERPLVITLYGRSLVTLRRLSQQLRPVQLQSFFLILIKGIGGGGGRGSHLGFAIVYHYVRSRQFLVFSDNGTAVRQPSSLFHE